MGVDVDHDGRVDRWNRDEVSAHQPPADADSNESAAGQAKAGAAEGEDESDSAAGDEPAK
jgi:hypothetical protein